MIEQVIEYFVTAYEINPLAQIIGAIGFLVSIYNFLFCENKKFIIFTAVASVAFGFHYYSLGLIAAAGVNAFDVVKNLLSLKYERNLKLVLGFSLIYLIIGYLTYTGELVSIIPTLTALASTYLVFYVRGIWLNIGFLFIILMWMVYNYLGNSIGGLSTDIFLIGFGLLGILRQILKNNKKSKNA
ncbi:YgjV family protein [Candidatus Gracilibacteria bacterium]|nr:YgjV family protein [Candidatus Gracilibacteria bacterium]